MQQFRSDFTEPAPVFVDVSGRRKRILVCLGSFVTVACVFGIVSVFYSVSAASPTFGHVLVASTPVEPPPIHGQQTLAPTATAAATTTTATSVHKVALAKPASKSIVVPTPKPKMQQVTSTTTTTTSRVTTTPSVDIPTTTIADP